MPRPDDAPCMWLNRTDTGRWRVEFEADRDAVQAFVPGAELDLDADTVRLDGLMPALPLSAFILAAGEPGLIRIVMPSGDVMVRAGIVRSIERLAE